MKVIGNGSHVATKWLYSFGLVNRTRDELLRCLKDLVETQMIKFPRKHKIRRYHADGGKELMEARRFEYGRKRPCFLPLTRML
jgi:hypothetical protein